MSKADPEDRRLNIHSHFAWSAGFWGSARQAEESGNFLLAPIGFYYSAFHAGYAAACTNLDIPNESFSRIGHAQLKGYLESILPTSLLSINFLQDVRETINYLGADSPTSKARVVRGHPFGFGTTPYFDCIPQCRDHAVRVIRESQKVIRDFGRKHSVNIPDINSELWIAEFLDDDLFLNVIPRSGDGPAILHRAFVDELPSLIKGV
jgi:hypothetical protein